MKNRKGVQGDYHWISEHMIKTQTTVSIHWSTAHTPNCHEAQAIANKNQLIFPNRKATEHYLKQQSRKGRNCCYCDRHLKKLMGSGLGSS